MVGYTKQYRAGPTIDQNMYCLIVLPFDILAINSALTKKFGATPTTGIELQERQSNSTSMVSKTSGDLESTSKGIEGRSGAEDGKLLPLKETNCSKGDELEVESCNLKGNSSDLLK